jgi:hypothetical protein
MMLGDDRAVGPIERFMVEDHVRIDSYMAACERCDGSVDLEVYGRFRHGLLRHIGMEEKVLLPFARAKRAGAPLEVASVLRADHGARLLVRTPDPALLDELRSLLARHNPLEEGPDGLYAACDRLADAEAPGVVARLQAQPAVPLAKFYDGPRPATR